jgi:hypothetical protein
MQHWVSLEWAKRAEARSASIRSRLRDRGTASRQERGNTVTTRCGNIHGDKHLSTTRLPPSTPPPRPPLQVPRTLRLRPPARASTAPLLSHPPLPSSNSALVTRPAKSRTPSRRATEPLPASLRRPSFPAPLIRRPSTITSPPIPSLFAPVTTFSPPWPHDTTSPAPALLPAVPSRPLTLQSRLRPPRPP